MTIHCSGCFLQHARARFLPANATDPHVHARMIAIFFSSVPDPARAVGRNDSKRERIEFPKLVSGACSHDGLNRSKHAQLYVVRRPVPAQ